jgi:hypothetical protein
MTKRLFQTEPAPNLVGTHDGEGAGDHDCPFTGFRRSSFTTREFVRLLLLRSDALDAHMGRGRWLMDLGSARMGPS